MATIITGTSVVAGANITLTSGQDLYILSGVTRGSTGDYAVRAEEFGHAIDVMGGLYGDLGGLRIGAANTFLNSRVNIGENGSIAGREDGIKVLGSGISITNAGEISGNTGIDFVGSGIALTNSGSITGAFFEAIVANSAGGTIVNTGVISSLDAYSSVYLVDGSTNNGVTATLINHGIITGAGYAVAGSADDRHTVDNHGVIQGLALGNANDSVINGGLISGLFFLGGGNDTYLGVGNGRVADLIEGGSGNDTLTGADRRDRIYGETGADVLRGGDGRDILDGGSDNDLLLLDGDGVSDRHFGGTGDDVLDGSELSDDLVMQAEKGVVRSGETGADRIEGFEELRGGAGDDLIVLSLDTRRAVGNGGDDTLRGGAGEDVLAGGDGNDTLSGGQGADQLAGGRGNDLLRGNGGADTFVFEDGFGLDTIEDFAARNDAEKISLVNVTAITDFADLAADHMVQRGANVLIRDGASKLVLVGVDLDDLDPADFLF